MPDLPNDDRTVHVTSPATPEALFERLASLGIRHRTVNHPAVFTVEEAKALRGPLDGSHTKNLFLRECSILLPAYHWPVLDHGILLAQWHHN